MHDNVWEWCQNRYADFTDMRDRKKDDKVDSNTLRGLRGGAFSYDPLLLRSAGRHPSIPEFLSNHRGFRVARTIR
jgi:formylglycine-generating enzyme required for sulfatase activity